MSHSLDRPIAHEYRGHELFIKFDWDKPNDEVPVSAHVVEASEVPGFANTVADLPGPWEDYPSALADAMATAERWVDSQLP
ncbi:hypothetical protein BOW65_09520 [Pseudomonas koreensis]|uniref:hypothetical protein n=1 Tax=Pseudomonas koreensis TaxID=198620 RepID=UPI0009861671|nr:hypothetical protein [Pseudomonas koreensis]OOH81310.1 hypothetical protein BOW65_09520 [Pseudomonas koreensis]